MKAAVRSLRCHKIQGCSYSTAVKLEAIKMQEFLTNTGCQAIVMAKFVQTHRAGRLQ